MVQRKKRGKKKTGRPPKKPNEKAVAAIHYACKPEELEIIEAAMELLRAELGDMVVDINRQLVVRVAILRLGKHMARADFSIVKEYLSNDET